ncbi:MAG: hypothetical protein ABFC88_02385 [Thermoguttaceae bacterium]
MNIPTPTTLTTPASTPTTGQNGDIGKNASDCGNTEQFASRNSGTGALEESPQPTFLTWGVILVVGLLAFIGFVARQVIDSHSQTTSQTTSQAAFSKVADQLGTLTPDTQRTSAVAIKPEDNNPQASRQDLINAGANVLKEIQQMRAQWVDRTDKTVGTLKAHYEMFRITLTEAQSDVLQKYINIFERLHAEGMAQFAAMENGSLELTSIRIRLERLRQLDQEWKEAGKEFARQGREAGLK